MGCRFFCLALLFILQAIGRVKGQAIDNTESFRSISSEKYFRGYYENDFFTGKDRDYTQGIYIEKVHPEIRHFFLTRLLLHPPNSKLKYGLAIEHDAYTPNYIDRPGIQVGDRPYAATLTLKTFITAVNPKGKKRITTVLTTGVIGPWAGGEEMQRTIHHWINYTQPLGWHNQMSNDLVLNYQINYEKEILTRANWLSVSSYSSVRVGTLSDKISSGFSFITGNFDSPYKPATSVLSRKWRWHLYYQPLVSLIGYDAVLEGPVFNHSSPYTIPTGDIRRLSFQHKYGIVLTREGFYIEYFQTGLTEEFNHYIFHRTGGIQIGFGF